MYLRKLTKCLEIIDSAATADDLYALIPKTACELLEYDRATLFIIDEDKFELASAYFVDDAERGRRLSAEKPALDMSLPGSAPEWRAVREGVTVRAGRAAVAKEPSYVCEHWLDLPSCALAPLVSGGQTLGFLSAGSIDGRHVDSDEKLEALTLYARSAAHILERLRSRTSTIANAKRSRQRIAELALLQQISQVLRSATTIDHILEVMADEIRSVVDYHCSIAAFYDESAKHWLQAIHAEDCCNVEIFEQKLAALEPTDLAATVPSTVGMPEKLFGPLRPMLISCCSSYLYVPIRVRDETQGFLMLATAERDAFSPSDLRLATAVADSAGIYASALRSENRLKSAFIQIGAALSSGLELDQTLQAIVEIAASLTQASGASIMILDPESNDFMIEACIRLEESFCRQAAVPADRTLALQVIKDGAGRIFRDVSELDVIIPSLTHGRQVNSLISMPIIQKDAPKSVIEVYATARDAFRESDLELMKWFAGHAGTALRNVLSFRREKNIAETFQTSLLVEPKPEFAGYDIATRYQAAFEEANVGGDFYDFIPMPDGKLGIVVGDVSGKGLRAAVYTAMAKYMLRAYAAQTTSPSSVVGLLNNALCRYTEPGLMFITLFFGILDSTNHTITYTSAGHEPALFTCSGDRQPPALDAQGTVLGLVEDIDYPETSRNIGPECSILLYTDGAIDALGPSGFLGTEGLEDIFNRYCRLDAGGIVDWVFRAVTHFAGGHLRDDIVLLGIKRTD